MIIFVITFNQIKKQKPMKKLSRFLLLLMMGAAFVACSSDDPVTTTPEPEPQPQPKPDPDPTPDWPLSFIQTGGNT